MREILIKAPLALAALTMAVSGAPAHADTLIDNVNGITLDREGELIRFTGLVFDDDGTVTQLLERRDDRPKDVDYKLDAKGKTMIPGMIDAHGHIMGIGFQALTLDLSQTTSLEEAQAAIADYAERFSNRPWIIGRGWNQEKWGLGRFPTAEEIDAVVSDRPVLLGRVDGHAAWANSKAMEIASITGKTPDPEGGRIERANGKPTGIFIDSAEELVGRFVPPPRPVDRDLAFEKAQEILLAQGVTAMADMGTTMEDWQSYRRAGDRGALKLRIMSYAAGIDAMIAIGGPGPTPWLYDDRLRLNGVKLYLDGALGSRGAWLKQPYADAPNEKGLQFLEDTQLLNMMSRASMDDFQLAVHAIGDRANQQVLDGLAEMIETFGKDRRWRIEHAQILDTTDLPRLAEYGAIASMQPVHQTSDRTMAERRLGPDRLKGAYAWRSVLESGAKLAFGSDAPVESANPFIGISVAMTREDANGEPFGGWQPSERISREQALAAFTIDAAWAGYAEGRFGSLTPGHRADFLLIDEDITLAPPSLIRSIQPSETWIGGERVWQSGNSSEE
ncbi:amidohydrolase [Alterisphingorhabdus coralli]|uniref:Amidohydrolase family protein n=1 Tax=Alterisphingorhabdus coralli TaxID=3071408 RepID=A0AA97F612_9SPHN|nr:amidohydrolase family protein [Parasphingorhabdus sp. SCSIO 66989]WOE74596.1 amidohydrolase family protein [Parasphingorhabdus sp. SCSIO 66989]